MKVEVAVLSSPSPIALMVSVDVRRRPWFRAQELCESRDGRPGLSFLTVFDMVSVDVKQHST